MSLAKLSTRSSALSVESGGQHAACLGWHAPSPALWTSSGAPLPAMLSVGLRKVTLLRAALPCQALEHAVQSGEDGYGKVFYCLGDASGRAAPGASSWGLLPSKT